MGQVQRIVIPYSPRPAFQPFHDRAKRWSCIVAHRRTGKTVACINDLIRAAVTCQREAPRYAYLAPFYAQAKDVAWAYLKRFVAPIPGVEAHESELRVTLPNGAMIRLYGADNYDRLRGIYLDGVILDEYGDMDPRAWSEVIRPALSDRQGWACFIGTPKGQNHFKEIWDQAGQDDSWFRLMLRASETGLLPAEELADAAKTMSDDQYAQEYECSFSAAVIGAYYGREMDAAERDGRITRVPYDPAHKVHVSWDLGVNDETALWFAQIVGREVRLIDYYEARNVGLDHYAKVLAQKPYAYQFQYLPHDGASKSIQTGKSSADILRTLNVGGEIVVGARTANVMDGINHARVFLAKCVFDAEKCADGIKALRNYRRHWDDHRKVFRDTPLHDWSSHAADSFRELAVNLRQPEEQKWKPIRYSAAGIV